MELPPIATLTQIQAAFAEGSLTPRALLDHSLQRAQEADSVFICLTESRARQAAQAATVRWQNKQALGLLDGIPLSWKDLFDQAGEVTRAASLTTAQAAPKAHDAVAVALLESIGAVSLGRTNLTEFAFSGLGLNPHFGPPANAWSQREALAPGGSSSGAALSVALGIVPYSMGTDTSGSVRIPAALNGLAGFKPGSGRLSRIGVWPLSTTLDSIGPLAHTVADICTVMQAFAVDADRVSDRHFKAIVPEGLYSEAVEPQIAQAFEDSIRKLQQAGVKIIRQPLPSLNRIPELFSQYGTLIGLEAWQLHQDSLAQAALMDERVAKRLLSNQAYPPQNLCELLAWRSRLQQNIAAELAGALLLMPTTAIDAPPLARLEQDQDYFFACNQQILRNTMATSFLDMPSLTLPTGLNRNGLPAALMVSAPVGHEETVLAAGREFARLLTGDQPLNAQRF